MAFRRPNGRPRNFQREKECLQLLLQGTPIKKISRRLQINRNTVRNILNRVGCVELGEVLQQEIDNLERKISRLTAKKQKILELLQAQTEYDNQVRTMVDVVSARVIRE